MEICKGTLFLCNCLFLLTGGVILGLGAYVYINVDGVIKSIQHFDAQSAVNVYNGDSSTYLMGLGVFMVCISLLSFAGACTGKDFPNNHTIYYIFLRIYSLKYKNLHISQ